MSESTSEAGGKRVILTRAARKNAGIPPPTPLFKHFAAKPTEITRTPSIEAGSSSSSSSGEDEMVAVGTGGRKKGSRRPRAVWVQCDSLSCRKWRTLSPDTHIDLSQAWYCHMHPDTAQNSCSVPEEKFKISHKRTFTFSRMEAGQMVWAKMAGFCPWPAVVSPDPWSEDAVSHMCEEREGCIYHVEFLGRDHTHSWLVEDKVEPFHGSHCKPQLGALKGSKPLSHALQEADSLMKLCPQERLEKCTFQKNSDVTIVSRSAAKKSAVKGSRKKGRGRPPNSVSVKTEPAEQQTEPHSCLDSSSSGATAKGNETAGKRSSTGKKKKALASRNIVSASSLTPHNTAHAFRLGQLAGSISSSEALQLLHSLGIPLSIDNVRRSVEASAPSVLPGDVRITHSTAGPDVSHTSALVPAKYSVAQSSFVQGTSSTGHTRSAKTQHHAAGFVTIGGTDALHKMQTFAVSSGENEGQLLAGQRAQALLVVPSTAQDYRKTAGSSGGGRFMQSSLGLASDRGVQASRGRVRGRRRGRGRGRGKDVVQGGRKRMNTGGINHNTCPQNSKKRNLKQSLQISPTIADYFQPAPSTSPPTVTAPVPSSSDQCVPSGVGDFHQLEDEAESELREMEEMLAALSGSTHSALSGPAHSALSGSTHSDSTHSAHSKASTLPAPPTNPSHRSHSSAGSSATEIRLSPTHNMSASGALETMATRHNPVKPDKKTCSQEEGKSVDCSIETVLNEMSEIEGLLQNLDGAQIVPYMH